MLLCAGCSGVYHMFCLCPALSNAPRADWFCPDCANKNPSSSQHALDERTAVDVVQRWYDTSFAQDIGWKMVPIKAYQNSAREWSIRYQTLPDSGSPYFMRAEYQAVKEDDVWQWHVLDFHKSGASEDLDSAAGEESDSSSLQSRTIIDNSKPGALKSRKRLVTSIKRFDPSAEACRPQWGGIAVGLRSGFA